MITPTAKSNTDSATNESNEWTIVEKKKTKKSNSNGGQTARANPKAPGEIMGKNLPAKNINQKHKCCLIYDDHYSNFRNEFFTRMFDVEVVQIKSVKTNQDL